MSTILETRGLTHVYGAGTPFERVALDHVDLPGRQDPFASQAATSCSTKIENP